VSDDRDDREDKDNQQRPRDGGGVRDLVDRAMEWLADVLAPTPAPVPVPVRVPPGRRGPARRR